MPTVRRLQTLSPAEIDALAQVLIDCVDGGASVSFMHPLPLPKARAFWQRVADDASRGARALLVAEDAEGIVGTVQLVLEQPENQPHRADLAKMLVHRRARRQGLGAASAGRRRTNGARLRQDAVGAGHCQRRCRAAVRPRRLAALRRGARVCAAAAWRSVRHHLLLPRPGLAHATGAGCVVTGNGTSQAPDGARFGIRRGFATTLAPFLVASRSGKGLSVRTASLRT